MINVLKNTDIIGTNNIKQVFGDDIFRQKPRLLFATHQIHITLISKSH